MSQKYSRDNVKQRLESKKLYEKMLISTKAEYEFMVDLASRDPQIKEENEKYLKELTNLDQGFVENVTEIIFRSNNDDKRHESPTLYLARLQLSILYHFYNENPIDFIYCYKTWQNLYSIMMESQNVNLSLTDNSDNTEHANSNDLYIIMENLYKMVLEHFKEKDIS